MGILKKLVATGMLVAISTVVDAQQRFFTLSGGSQGDTANAKYEAQISEIKNLDKKHAACAIKGKVFSLDYNGNKHPKADSDGCIDSLLIKDNGDIELSGALDVAGDVSIDGKTVKTHALADPLTCTVGNKLKWDGSAWVCEAEDDPEVGNLVSGKWCAAVNGKVVCDRDTPTSDLDVDASIDKQIADKVRDFARKDKSALEVCSPGEVLTSDGNTLKCASFDVLAEGTLGLDDLSDVTVNLAAVGDLLYFDGTDWKNGQVVEPWTRREIKYQINDRCQAGDVITYDGTQLLCIPDIGGEGDALAFDDLSDVSGTVDATLTNVIGWDGTHWTKMVEQDTATMPWAKTDIINLTATACGVDEVLTYDGTQLSCVADIGGAGNGIALGTLTDVSLTAPTLNQMLAFDGTNWVNLDEQDPNVQPFARTANPLPNCPAGQILTSTDGATLSCVADADTAGAGLALDDLTDVSITTPVVDDLLVYTAGGWRNTSTAVESFARTAITNLTGSRCAANEVLTYDGTQLTCTLVDTTKIGADDSGVVVADTGANGEIQIDVDAGRVATVGASGINVAGAITATTLAGDGSGITNINTGALTIGIDDLTDAKHDTDDYSSLFLGNGAGANDDGTSNENVAIGKNAMNNSTATNNSVAVGSGAMLDGSDRSVAIGSGAGRSMGFDSVAIGHSAGQSVGQHTVVIGSQAGDNGSGNAIVGFYAFNKGLGNNNVALGRGAASNQTTGDNNIAIGANVDLPNLTGSDQLNIGNLITGDLAGKSVLFDGDGRFTGTLTIDGALNVSGTQSIDGVIFANGGIQAANTITATAFAGDGSALTGVTASSANWYSLTGIPTGVADISNTALTTAELTQLQNIDATTISATQFGYLGALDQGVATTDNVTFANTQVADLLASGVVNAAGDISTAADLTVAGRADIGTDVSVTGTLQAAALIGDGSGITNINTGALTIGLDDLTDAKHDTDDYSSLFLGNGAGANDDGTSNENIGIGFNALTSNVSGNKNVALGDYALSRGDAASRNTGLGLSALGLNQSGNDNAALGLHAGRGSAVGGSNVSQNVFVGSYAGSDVITGADNNTFIGFRSGDSVTSGTRNILIGSGVDTSAPTASDELNIGNLITGDLAGKSVLFDGDGRFTGTLKIDGALNVSGTQSIDGVIFANGGIEAAKTITATAFVGDGSGLTGLIGEFQAFGDVVRNTSDLVNDDFVFGSTQLADTGDANHDARMFFDKSKGAFRAGFANGNQWDDANVGPSSIALGVGAVASAPVTTAFGLDTQASGLVSTAFGSETKATADYAVAFGHKSTASGEYSTAFGHTSTASGGRSFAVGDNVTASGASSAAFGIYTVASGAYSTAFGSDTKAESSNSTVLGRFNVGGGDRFNWLATDPLFEIGNGVDNSNRANALTVLKNGNVGIGLTAPAYALDVSGTIHANAVSATQFIGDGSGLTNISAGAITLTVDDLIYAKHNITADALSIGENAGRDSQSTALRNVFLGDNAGFANRTGDDNVAVGYGAGFSVNNNDIFRTTLLGTETGRFLRTNSADNTFLGYRAGYNVTTGARNILIGSGVDTSAPTDSDKLNIGNLISGDMAAGTVAISGTTTNTAELNVDGTLKVAGTNAEVCIAGDVGRIRFNSATGRLQICRP